MKQDLAKLEEKLNAPGIAPLVLELMKSSDRRMEKTNRMIQQLSKACSANMKMYDKHITSLEVSRDAAHRIASENIELSKRLTSLLEECRAEMHKERTRMREEIELLKSDCRKLSDCYIRLAEQNHKNVAEVNIK